jgi:hypothetical protein
MIRRALLPAVGIVTAALLIGSAFAAGVFTPGLPNPTGPLTGIEEIPADTNLPSGQNPQSEAISTQQLIGFAGQVSNTAGFRNALINGAMNIWQRGVGPSADIANTLTYQADRWWNLGGASSAIDVTKETGAADVTATYVASLRFQRKATNADVVKICTGQVLETVDSSRFQGRTAEFSFWALAGANFSAAASALQVTVATGTGVDGSAANFAAGTWTGYANAVQAATPITATWNRYVAQVAIPVTAVQVGVSLCYTPVGTAGTNDWFEFTGAQLAVNQAGTPGYLGPASAASLMSYEHRPAAAELMMAQRYEQNIAEPAAGIVVAPSGQGASTTTCTITIPLANPMRAAPTVTFPGTAPAATTWTITHVVTATALATPFLAGTAAGSTPTMINVTATTAAVLTVGQTCVLTGAGGGGQINASAEL